MLIKKAAGAVFALCAALCFALSGCAAPADTGNAGNTTEPPTFVSASANLLEYANELAPLTAEPISVPRHALDDRAAGEPLTYDEYLALRGEYIELYWGDWVSEIPREDYEASPLVWLDYDWHKEGYSGDIFGSKPVWADANGDGEREIVVIFNDSGGSEGNSFNIISVSDGEYRLLVKCHFGMQGAFVLTETAGGFVMTVQSPVLSDEELTLSAFWLLEFERDWSCNAIEIYDGRAETPREDSWVWDYLETYID
jgi:hypothetical protein